MLTLFILSMTFLTMGKLQDRPTRFKQCPVQCVYTTTIIMVTSDVLVTELQYAHLTY